MARHRLVCLPVNATSASGEKRVNHSFVIGFLVSVVVIFSGSFWFMRKRSWYARFFLGAMFLTMILIIIGVVRAEW